MNVHVLNNLQAIQTHNEKKTIDNAKKEKTKIECDQLQIEAQHLQEVQQPLQVQLTFDMLRLTTILVWGVGFISCSALSQVEKDDDLAKGI